MTPEYEIRLDAFEAGILLGLAGRNPRCISIQLKKKLLSVSARVRNEDQVKFIDDGSGIVRLEDKHGSVVVRPKNSMDDYVEMMRREV